MKKKEITRVAFNFHDITSLAVEGRGELVDYLCYQYREFIQTNNNNEVDLTLFIGDTSLVKEISNYYSEGKFKYYKASDDFCWCLCDQKVSINGSGTLASISHIHCDAGFNRIQLNTIIELFLRIRFSNANIALVHAACFSIKSRAILVPAARSAGKTALCLNALKTGSKFLSDDRLWLSSTGKAYAFPRYIVITKSNSTHFHKWQGKRNMYCSWLRNTITGLTPGSRLKRLVKRILGRVVPFKAVYYKLEELYPSCDYEIQADLAGTALLICDKDSNNKLQAIESKTVEHFVSQVANLEWNYDVLKAASIHDMLFISESKWHTELQDLIRRERKTVKKALEEKANYCLPLNGDPEKTDWNDIIGQLHKDIFKEAS